MRVILDTNVFVSAVFFGGKPGKILKAWRDGEVRLVLSPDILEEYIEVLHRLETLYPPVEADPNNSARSGGLGDNLRPSA